MLHRVYFLLLALVLLSGCTDGNERRLQLEELERQNRADSLMTNDSLALDLAQWFDRHGTPNEQLRAHYILGRTYADRGETPQALNAYNDAADRADTTAKDCDYRTLSRVHAQMAQLYYSQLLPDNMIRHNRLAMRYAEAANDTMGYIACYAMLAEGYEMKIMPDSALDILSEAYQLYKDADANELAAGLCCSMADLFRQKDNYIQSEKCIQEYERDSEFFNEYGNVESGKEMYYYSKGQLCLDSSDKDNAEYYFRKLLSVANNYDLEIAALDGLQRFYAKFFNRDSLIKYVHLRDSICNIAHNNIEMQKTLQVQAMYDYTRSELVAIQKEREAERFKTTMIIFSALSVILALSSAIVYICNQNEKRRLKDRIRLLQGYAVNKNLYDSPIAQRFRECLKANPYQNPSLSDWKELSALINREIPDFRKRLQTDSYQLSDNDYDVCMLIKIQIPASDIARFKQCAPSYITQIRKNIYQKLFMKKGKANELDEYIMSLC
jgi:DNA-binding CsgD family transcriptional regulator